MRAVISNCLTIGLIFFLASCNNPTKKQSNELIIDTNGYYAARDLRGLSGFTIGDSYKKTYQNLVKVINADERYYTSIMGASYYITEVRYDTLASLIEKFSHEKKQFGYPSFKSIKVDKYYIGDIEFEYLELNFFHDTLITIRSLQDDQIDEGFKLKYGNGKTIDSLKSNLLLKTFYSVDRLITWQNDKVIAESRIKIMKNKYAVENYFKMTTKDSKIQDRIKKCEQMAEATKQRILEAKKQKNIDAL